MALRACFDVPDKKADTRLEEILDSVACEGEAEWRSLFNSLSFALPSSWPLPCTLSRPTDKGNDTPDALGDEREGGEAFPLKWGGSAVPVRGSPATLLKLRLRVGVRVGDLLCEFVRGARGDEWVNEWCLDEISRSEASASAIDSCGERTGA